MRFGGRGGGGEVGGLNVVVISAQDGRVKVTKADM